MQPAIDNRLGGGFWAVQIALNDGRTFDTNFSHLPHRKFLPVLVNHFAIKGGGQVAATGWALNEHVPCYVGDDPADFGHAIALRRSRFFGHRIHFFHKIRLYRRTTTAHTCETRGVVIIKIRMRQKLSRHHGHGAQGINALCLNELQRLKRVPFVHQDKSITRKRPGL